MEIKTSYRDKTAFEFEGGTHYLVSMLSTKKHLHVVYPRKSMGAIESQHMRMPVSALPIKTLKEIEVWDDMDSKIKEGMEEHDKLYKTQAHEKMAKARSGRKRKYPNIPRELQCTTCPALIPVPPGTTSKKVDKLGVTLDQYLAQYRCQKCHPTRGRPRKNK